MGRLEGKVAIVTGARSGIGQATAIRFAEEGAKVVCCARRGADDTVNEIKQQGGEALSVKTDVSRLEDWRDLLNKTHEAFGDVDILCNIAGVAEIGTNILDVTEEHWNNILNINLKGLFFGMQAVLPEMVKNGGGKILNCSSISAHIGVDGVPCYTASKGAVGALSRQVAMQYADKNIQVNVVSPGIVATDMTSGDPELIKALMAFTPAGRLGQPREIAHLFLFLASNEADWITGQDFLIDGGWSAR